MSTPLITRDDLLVTVYGIVAGFAMFYRLTDDGYIALCVGAFVGACLMAIVVALHKLLLTKSPDDASYTQGQDITLAVGLLMGVYTFATAGYALNWAQMTLAMFLMLPVVYLSREQLGYIFSKKKQAAS